MRVTSVYPAGALLETWAGRPWRDGLQLDRLSALDELSVRTRNNVYRIVVIAPSRGDVVVQGGRFFTERTRAHLAGCSLGGSFLKARGIYVGFRMEILVGRETIITSDVQSIQLVPCERPH
jgi:hypothetical protein